MYFVDVQACRATASNLESTMSMPRIHRLSLDPATPANVAPYGRLIGASAARPRTSSFYGDAVELWSPGTFQSDHDTCMTVARVHPRANEVIWMERHFKHTQAFIPLGGAPFAVVLGEPTGTHTPDPKNVRALHFDGSAGLLMHIGTWHEFPFAIDRAVDLVVVLRNETNRDLDVIENDEAIGGDLEKRNVRVRLDLVFAF